MGFLSYSPGADYQRALQAEYQWRSSQPRKVTPFVAPSGGINKELTAREMLQTKINEWLEV